jgi:phage shock protein E
MKRIAPVLLAAVAACTSASTPAKAPSVAAASSLSAAPPATFVDGQEAHRLVAAGVKVVDVRTPEEFAQGHVPGAVNIPYDEIPERAKEIGAPSKPVLLYCHSGRRSGMAVEALRERGFTQLYDMKRYQVWVEAEPAPAAR